MKKGSTLLLCTLVACNMGVGIAMAWKGNEVTDVYQKSISEKKYHQDVGPSEEYM
jgi:hypothetical protein